MFNDYSSELEEIAVRAVEASPEIPTSTQVLGAVGLFAHAGDKRTADDALLAQPRLKKPCGRKPDLNSRERRLARNRLNARLSRARKKHEREKLTATNNLLIVENSILKIKIDLLTAQVEALRQGQEFTFSLQP